MGINKTSAVWKNIFDFLRREEAFVGGRTDERAGELRKKMELFARGELPAEEIDGLCSDLASTPEAVEALVRLLRRENEGAE